MVPLAQPHHEDPPSIRSSISSLSQASLRGYCVKVVMGPGDQLDQNRAGDFTFCGKADLGGHIRRSPPAVSRSSRTGASPTVPVGSPTCGSDHPPGGKKRERGSSPPNPPPRPPSHRYDKVRLGHPRACRCRATSQNFKGAGPGEPKVHLHYLV